MKKKSVIAPYLFISPWMIGFIVFTAGPLLMSLIMSFFDWSITKPPVFSAFKNYITMFTQDKQFYRSLFITLKYAVIFVPLNMCLALFLALLISQPVAGVRFFRTVFYIPTVISGVAVSIVWGWLLNADYGIFNYLLSLIGISGPKWLLDPSWALVAVVLASAFGVGTMMLIFYANIKTIPADLYEAADLDGAGVARQFFSITLPIITPTILFNLITSLITAFQQLTLVMLLTGGGPGNSTQPIVQFIYNNGFRFQDLGLAAAAAWILFAVIIVLTALQFRAQKKWVHYEY